MLYISIAVNHYVSLKARLPVILACLQIKWVLNSCPFDIFLDFSNLFIAKRRMVVLRQREACSVIDAQLKVTFCSECLQLGAFCLQRLSRKSQTSCSYQLAEFLTLACTAIKQLVSLLIMYVCGSSWYKSGRGCTIKSNVAQFNEEIDIIITLFFYLLPLDLGYRRNVPISLQSPTLKRMAITLQTKPASRSPILKCVKIVCPSFTFLLLSNWWWH